MRWSLDVRELVRIRSGVDRALIPVALSLVTEAAILVAIVVAGASSRVALVFALPAVLAIVQQVRLVRRGPLGFCGADPTGHYVALVAVVGLAGWGGGRRLASARQEVIAHAAARTGPPLIIGEPGEQLPRLGAARQYVPDSEWQQEVAGIMAEAARLFFVPGDSESLRWEVATAVERRGLDRIVLVVPPVGAKEVAQRWRSFVEANRAVLSDGVDGGPPAPAGELVAVLFLERTPVFVTSGDRRIWSYLTALQVIAVIDDRPIATVAGLQELVDTQLPPARLGST